MREEKERTEDLRVLRLIHTGVRRKEKEGVHPFHELYYISEGSCSVFIGHRVYALKEGDFAVIPAGAPHRTDYISTGQNTKYVVSFSRKTAKQVDVFLGEELTGKILRPGRIRVPVQRREAIGRLLARMLYEYENQPTHAASFCKACLAEVLISLERYREGQEEAEGLVSPKEERMQAVAAYLAEHLREDLNLTELARVFALSPSHLSRTFHEATGFGIREYLISLRIQRAGELLLNSGLTITEIADQCGFSDGNYFGDAFRRTMGVSPREYRKLG